MSVVVGPDEGLRIYEGNFKIDGILEKQEGEELSSRQVGKTYVQDTNDEVVVVF